MSKKMYEDLLYAFKKSNKERRLIIANKAGYTTSEQYQKYLTNQITGSVVKEIFNGKNISKKRIVNKPTIHIVDIIDCSGSMSGSKIKTANEGINQGIVKLKEDKIANYTYTLCNFSNYNDIEFAYIQSNIDKVDNVYFNTRGNTALNDAIGKTLTLLKEKIKKGEKVLVNIYTDGGENGSREYSSSKVSTLIKSLEGIFTVTFIGTVSDTKTIIRNLNIDESNTLVYNGSAEELKKSINDTIAARSVFSASVSEGKDVSKGFYKNIIKK